MGGDLHITSGDASGNCLVQSGLSGDVVVWRDILYDGLRRAGWPNDDILQARAQFLDAGTDGAIGLKPIFNALKKQYAALENTSAYDRVILWFDSCLFDQAMLVHLLARLYEKRAQPVELICVDSFPGIVPFNGLGQLSSTQLLSLFETRRPVTEPQFQFAVRVDEALATRNIPTISEMAVLTEVPLLRVPAALARWLQELPDATTGLGRLEQLALAAMRNGAVTPMEIFAAVAAADVVPQFWGDTTLWAKINGLSERQPPLVHIEGPAPRLPQWESPLDLDSFRITAV